MIIAIVAVIAIVGVYFSGIFNNSEISNSNDWEIKELAGLKFKLPEKYSKGILLSGNIIDSVKTGNSYESNNGGFIINVYLSDENSTERDNEYNSYMGANSTIEILNISGQDIIVVCNDTSPQPFSVAFFEVNGDKVVLKWDGTSVDADIKAVVASFYELN